MNEPSDLAATLIRSDLLSEVHHFLWQAPSSYRGNPDPGWNCRDHALVVGHFVELLGGTPTVRHGRCTFVQGPTSAGAPPVGIGQEVGRGVGHSWLFVEGLGDVDISPNLAARGTPWRPISSPGVIGSTLLADRDTRVEITDTPHDYDQAVAKATYEQDVIAAIYLLEREQTIALDDLADGLSFAHSPCSERLKARGAPANVHQRLARHLMGLQRGDRRALAGVSVNKAWSLLARDPGLDE